MICIDKKYYIIATLISIIIAICAGLWAHKTTSTARSERDVAIQNMIAARDTVRITRISKDRELAEKNAYISTKELNIEDLEKQLGVAKNELSKLKSVLKSDFNTISNIETKIIYDTIYTTINNDLDVYKFNYNDEWLSISGETDLENIKFNNINIPGDLVVGTTTDKKIFVETKNPYLHVKNISGSILVDDKKKSHWNVGLGIGFGVQYGVLNKKIDLGPQITCGVTYSFF